MTSQYCSLHVFPNSYLDSALIGRPCIIGRFFSLWSPKFTGSVTESFTGLILPISQSTIFILFVLILELSFPPTVLFPYPRARELDKKLLIINLPCKEAEIYNAFLLQKLFCKCLEKKTSQH